MIAFAQIVLQGSTRGGRAAIQDPGDRCSEASWIGDRDDEGDLADAGREAIAEQPEEPAPAVAAEQPVVGPQAKREAEPPEPLAAWAPAASLRGRGPAPGIPEAAGTPGRGEATYIVADIGRVTYYRKGAFEANCRHHLGDCRKTRTNKPPSGWRIAASPGQGRPVAELVVWLEKAAEFSSASDHMAFTPPVATRASARERLVASGGHAAASLMAFERPLRPTEAADESAIGM